jgi:hypothetical protein
MDTEFTPPRKRSRHLDAVALTVTPNSTSSSSDRRTSRRATAASPSNSVSAGSIDSKATSSAEKRPTRNASVQASKVIKDVAASTFRKPKAESSITVVDPVTSLTKKTNSIHAEMDDGKTLKVYGLDSDFLDSLLPPPSGLKRKRSIPGGRRDSISDQTPLGTARSTRRGVDNGAPSDAESSKNDRLTGSNSNSSSAKSTKSAPIPYQNGIGGENSQKSSVGASSAPETNGHAEASTPSENPRKRRYVSTIDQNTISTKPVRRKNSQFIKIDDIDDSTSQDAEDDDDDYGEKSLPNTKTRTIKRRKTTNLRSVSGTTEEPQATSLLNRIINDYTAKHVSSNALRPDNDWDHDVFELKSYTTDPQSAPREGVLLVETPFVGLFLILTKDYSLVKEINYQPRDHPLDLGGFFTTENQGSLLIFRFKDLDSSVPQPEYLQKRSNGGATHDGFRFSSSQDLNKFMRHVSNATSISKFLRIVDRYAVLLIARE